MVGRGHHLTHPNNRDRAVYRHVTSVDVFVVVVEVSSVHGQMLHDLGILGIGLVELLELFHRAVANQRDDGGTSDQPQLFAAQLQRHRSAVLPGSLP